MEYEDLAMHAQEMRIQRDQWMHRALEAEQRYQKEIAKASKEAADIKALVGEAMGCLTYINGQLVINEEALERLEKALKTRKREPS